MQLVLCKFVAPRTFYSVTNSERSRRRPSPVVLFVYQCSQYGKEWN